jgi:hypothetical protein
MGKRHLSGQRPGAGQRDEYEAAPNRLTRTAKKSDHWEAKESAGLEGEVQIEGNAGARQKSMTMG